MGVIVVWMARVEGGDLGGRQDRMALQRIQGIGPQPQLSELEVAGPDAEPEVRQRETLDVAGEKACQQFR